jgi:hypothetical protein
MVTVRFFSELTAMDQNRYLIAKDLVEWLHYFPGQSATFWPNGETITKNL